jgi:hypothetical protein
MAISFDLGLFVKTTTWMSFSIGIVMLGLSITALILALEDDENVNTEPFITQTDVSTGRYVGIVVPDTIRTDMTPPSTTVVAYVDNGYSSVATITPTSELHAYNSTIAFSPGVKLTKYIIPEDYGGEMIYDSELTLTQGNNNDTRDYGKTYFAYIGTFSPFTISGVNLQTFSHVTDSASSVESFTYPSIHFFKDSDYGIVLAEESSTNTIYIKGFSAGATMSMGITKTLVVDTIDVKFIPLSTSVGIIADLDFATFVSINTSTLEVTVGASFKLPCFNVYAMIANIVENTIGFIGNGSLNKGVGKFVLYMHKYSTSAQTLTYENNKYAFPVPHSGVIEQQAYNFSHLNHVKHSYINNTGLNIINQKTPTFSWYMTVKITTVDVEPVTSIIRNKLYPIPITSDEEHVDFLVADQYRIVKGFMDLNYHQVFTSKTNASEYIGKVASVSGTNANIEKFVKSIDTTSDNALYPGLKYFYHPKTKQLATNNIPGSTYVGIAKNTSSIVTMNTHSDIMAQ